MTDTEVASSTGARPVRYAMVLPEPMPFPDGHGSFVITPESAGTGVQLRFYQQKNEFGRTRGAYQALHDALARLGGEERDNTIGLHEPDFDFSYTVVLADTIADWDWLMSGEFSSLEHPWDTPAEFDPLNRCITALLYFARAYRLATSTLYPPLSYERILPMVLVARWDEESQAFGEFDQILMLHHLNLPDAPPGETIEGDLLTRFDYFFGEQVEGTPLLGMSQRLADARRALLQDGDYALTTVLAAVAAEVLLDTVVLLLLWEEGMNPADAADLLSANEAQTQKISRLLVPRLKGHWTFKSGPVADWLLHTVRMRSRVVHANYEPTRIEAAAALDASYNLQTYIFDKLASQRNAYPRSTLISIAQEGLVRRNLWAGKIKKFFETRAPHRAELETVFPRLARGPGGRTTFSREPEECARTEETRQTCCTWYSEKQETHYSATRTHKQEVGRPRVSVIVSFTAVRSRAPPVLR